MSEKYGDYYRTSFGPTACLNTSDPSLIEGVLKTNARSYHKSALARLILGALLGYENILLAEDEKHSRHRRLVAPVFQHQNINSMISLMVERTSSFLMKWKTATTNDKDHSLTLDIHEELTNLTLDIITGCVFGTEISGDQHIHETIGKSITIAMKEAEKRMLNMIAIIPLVNQLPLPSKQRIDKSRQDIKHIIRNIINQRKKGLTKSACKGFIIISTFMFFIFF
jgi:cytochrome P450